MRKSQPTLGRLILTALCALLPLVAAVPVVTHSAQQQSAPRKYLIKPLNLGTNTEIRARSTRNLQVQVTDENDRPVSDVPLLFLLAGLAAGRGGNLGTLVAQSGVGNVAGQTAGSNAGSLAGQAASNVTGAAGAGQSAGSGAGSLAGQGAGSSSVGNAASQLSARAVTNQYGVATVNFTAPDAVGNSLRLQVRVEGTDVMWEGELSVVRAEAVAETSLSVAPVATTASLPTLDAEEKACVDLINQFRAEHQHPPLKVSVKLTLAAQWLSRDNADNKPDDPSHTDSLGRDVGTRLRHFGYDISVLKENIVVGADAANATMQVWKASGFHIRNLLNADVILVGVGRVCKKGAKSGCHWTVILGDLPDQTIP